MSEKIATLRNGRKYRIIDTGKPYVTGEYPSGGFIIDTWIEIYNKWVYLDNCEDIEFVNMFLRLAEKGPCLNIPALAELQNMACRQNNGNGVQCVKAIHHTLLAGKYDDAKIMIETDWDKISNYPDIANFFKKWDLANQTWYVK